MSDSILRQLLTTRVPTSHLNYADRAVQDARRRHHPPHPQRPADRRHRSHLSAWKMEWERRDIAMRDGILLPEDVLQRHEGLAQDYHMDLAALLP